VADHQEVVAMELLSINPRQNSPATAAPEINDNKPTILVVEDNPDMRHYVVQSINDEYQVLTAQDGVAGCEIAISQVPDLIISDIMMPKKDGYQLTSELREHETTNHIPIILLTARGDRDSRLKGWHEKADEYLTKPFDAEELNIRINNLLAIRNLVKQRFAQTVLATTETVEPEPVYQDVQQLQFVEKLDEVLEELYIESATAIVDIADKMAMSERQLFRKLKSILDITPAEYMRRFRLEKAKTLLQQGRSVSFATFEVGFSTNSYFGKCFKAQYGLSPSDYKKSLQRTEASSAEA
jgi:DNA-binding response OmpR family regulator